MKAYVGVDVQIHVLTSVLDRGKRPASQPGQFTPPSEKEPLVPIQ
jgi:hypothetical protein